MTIVPIDADATDIGNPPSMGWRGIACAIGRIGLGLHEIDALTREVQQVLALPIATKPATAR